MAQAQAMVVAGFLPAPEPVAAVAAPITMLPVPIQPTSSVTSLSQSWVTLPAMMLPGPGAGNSFGILHPYTGLVGMDVDRPYARISLLNHRASFHGRGGSGDPNGHALSERLTHSMPGSPADRRPTSFEVLGSAESLVGRILHEQGLGKYCDPDFVRYTSREMQEALDMTQEEMDRAAHQLLQQNRGRDRDHMGPNPNANIKPASSSPNKQSQPPL